jgi:hypothetical protein
MPWDAPHRFLGWSYLPLPWENWAVAGLLEGRSGYPFSTINEDGRVQGTLNARRFPYYFTSNLHLERRFRLAGYHWELRAGFVNLTGRRNPNVVNSNIDSPNYLRFYGGQSRSFNFRIRWLGKARR